MLSRNRSMAQRGFTLIELLITVVLSSLVGVLIYTVFISQTEAYRQQADMGTMQQNLRIAMEMVTRDVGSAGFGMAGDGGTWGLDGQDGQPNVPLYGIRIIDDWLTAGPDAIEMMMMSPDRNNWGFTSNEVARHRCDTETITFTPSYAAAAGLFDSSTSTNRIMCFSPVGRLGRPASYLWSVAGVGDASAGTVPITAGTQTDYTAQCNRGLPWMMACGPVRHVAYYIDSNDTDGFGIGSAALPVLYFVPDLGASQGIYPSATDIPVALGIEDLQFQTCEAGTSVDCELDSSWTPGYDLTGTSAWDNLGGIRVNMTARTIRPDLNRVSVSSPIDIDPLDFTIAASANLDGYHRRVARTEVKTRNSIGAWQMMQSQAF